MARKDDKQISKGDLVRVAKKEQFRPNHGWRNITSQEVEAWYADPSNHGMDDAGESRLPPRWCEHPTKETSCYVVLAARKAPVKSYGQIHGQCLLLDLENGVEFYVPRDVVTVVQG